jgi:hypothetical protein
MLLRQGEARNLHRRSQKLLREQDEVREQVEELRDLQGQLAVLRTNFELMDTLRTRQESWLRLLAGLEEALVRADGAWLEELQTIPASPLSSKITLRGRLLLPAGKGPAKDATDRLNGLVQAIRNVAGVEEVADLAFPPKTSNFQPFSCTLILESNSL